jgi:cephalosporin-C deacetylase
MVYIGLQDNVCPPETGYAVWRSIASEDKHLYPYDGHGHDAGIVHHSTVLDDFFKTHLKEG